MSDLKPYREQVAELGKLANQAETDKQYEAAYNYYTQALDVFVHLMKCKSPVY
jgi:type IV secretory pathway TrbF-like protein